ncbi:hypothetical protein D1BOALGB6SA_77 [Olavius sp. associated proteobacterium Delta 1]|nr:hypothetical protein D1BOALGB6SA_77 [Olavius sp. associated proteobacterium Delta 1]
MILKILLHLKTFNPHTYTVLAEKLYQIQVQESGDPKDSHSN